MQPLLFPVSPTKTVGELMRHLKQVLNDDAVAPDVWVRGEISNLTRAGSGHLYFSLKDNEASIKCVMWRGQAAGLPRLPANGDAIRAHGYVGLYEARGDLQLYVNEVEFDGAGTLWQQYEALKAKLEKEGLFGRHRPLPMPPTTIGIVTSESGAALQDMLRILSARWPLAEVVLSPCMVQGADAPPQIVRAIKALNRRRGVDVIIVARGGGSLEDLWAFNDEAVARAIHASPQPVVSGVGHETDFTIADFVADERAPTPTAAAQLVTPDRAEWLRGLHGSRMQLFRAARERVAAERTRLTDTQRALRRLAPRNLIDFHRQRVDDARRALGLAIAHAVQSRRERLHGKRAHLEAVSPLAILARGYAIVRKDGRVVAHAAQARPGDEIAVRVSDGEFGATVRHT
ncbi:MAG: exodeoxyribonuclease VII large subunit [Chloroflexi bacterium]|nr:exodeoxyribonuclease VII large subunit [Chloroflexota bacterium]